MGEGWGWSNQWAGKGVGVAGQTSIGQNVGEHVVEYSKQILCL